MVFSPLSSSSVTGGYIWWLCSCVLTGSYEAGYAVELKKSDMVPIYTSIFWDAWDGIYTHDIWLHDPKLYLGLLLRCGFGRVIHFHFYRAGLIEVIEVIPGLLYQSGRGISIYANLVNSGHAPWQYIWFDWVWVQSNQHQYWIQFLLPKWKLVLQSNPSSGLCFGKWKVHPSRALQACLSASWGVIFFHCSCICSNGQVKYAKTYGHQDMKFQSWNQFLKSLSAIRMWCHPIKIEQIPYRAVACHGKALVQETG